VVKITHEITVVH